MLRGLSVVMCGVAAVAVGSAWKATVLEEGTSFWGTAATAINARGQVVGTGLVGDKPPRAFLWDGGKMTGLGVLAGAPADGESWPVAINDTGTVAGSSSAAGGAFHAFVWRSGKLVDLGTLPGKRNSEAVDVNNDGSVTGNSYASRASGSGALVAVRAFVWQGARLRDLGSLGGRSTSAAAINDRGQIVGWSETKTGVRHAFVWTNGRMRDLGTLPQRRYCEAVAINTRGEIAGSCYSGLSPDTQPPGLRWPPGEAYRKTDLRAFVWRNGTLTAVTPDTTAPSIAVAISDSGQVIGDTLTRGTVYPTLPHGFSSRNGRAALLSGPRGTTTSAALALNARGEIVGWAGVEGAYSAYLWQGATRTALPNPGGAGHDDKVSASAITADGTVVGTRTATMDAARAVLWSRR